MPYLKVVTQINGLSVIHAVSKTLNRIDPRLVDHGERVAFIACELRDEGKLPLDEKALFLLSAFHDIGAYKTEEIDHMVEFETENVQDHAIFGYLFLKYMSPLSEVAEALRYHHTSWEEILASGCPFGEYAALIHLSDRVDIAMVHAIREEDYRTILTERAGFFRPEYVELFLSCFQKRRILERLKDGSYLAENRRRTARFHISDEETLDYLKMLVYSIDFRSNFTVTHTANTVSIALDIARHFGLEEQEQEKIYLGALLHDVGKIAIPPQILNSPGQLDKDEMKIMRTHVTETENMIRPFLPEEICRIAVRHHEKLDGSGYPQGITGDEITPSQRIVAISDIVSALASRRSYKDPYPREKTIAILRELQQGKLDAEYCEYICQNYEEIMARADRIRNDLISRYQRIVQEFQCLRQEQVAAAQ